MAIDPLEAAYRAGFLRRCAASGRGPREAEAAAAALEKSAVLLSGAGELLSSLSRLGLLGFVAAPAAAAGAGGYGLGYAAADGLGETRDPDEYRKAELVAALRRASARLQSGRAAAGVAGPLRSPYGL